MKRILAINPGSTSTKVGAFEDDREIWSKNISHPAAELARFGDVAGQLEYRLAAIRELLNEQGSAAADFDAFVGRGGVLKPVPGGTYGVNDAILEDMRRAPYGAHASNLGAILAQGLAAEHGKPAFIVDPVVVDEMTPLAKVTGRPEIEKRSMFHALNQKAVARRLAREVGRRYDELNLIVAHLGGGISVGCHRRGKVVQVGNALDGEGAFSPERAGSLPAGQFAALIIDGRLTKAQAAKLLAGQGGLAAHLGVSDAREVEARIAAGDARAELVYNAMIYQAARHIAAAAVPVCGKVDYIIITGGIAHSRYVTDRLRQYVGFIAPIKLYPGEDELKALAEGALRVLTGEEAARDYV